MRPRVDRKSIFNKFYIEDKTLEDIGLEMGVTRQRVSQILQSYTADLWGSARLPSSIKSSTCKVCGKIDYFEVFNSSTNRLLRFIPIVPGLSSYVCTNCSGLYRCRCGHVGPESDFTTKRDSSHRGICRKCNTTMGSEYYKKNRKKVMENSLRWGRKNRSYFKGWCKKRYDERVSKGVCTYCGGQREDTAFKYCLGCRTKLRALHSSIIAKRRSNNLCVICGKDRSDNIHVMCLECRDYLKKRQDLVYQDRLSRNVCTMCGNPKEDPKFKNCLGCRNSSSEKYRKFINRRKDSGLCCSCGEKRENLDVTMCDTCLEKSRERYYRKHSRMINYSKKGFVRIKGEATTKRVWVNGRELTPSVSLSIINHSSEFNWGYGGSGPAQLALAILLEIMPDRDGALQQYETFKNNVIAQLTEGKDFDIEAKVSTATNVIWS